MKKQIVSMVVAAAFIAPSLASAHVEVEKVDENKVIVSYSSMEASTAIGRVELESQIRHAAAEVCGPQRLIGAGSLSEYVANRACFREALSKAMAKV
jgi:UrcA family protein